MAAILTDSAKNVALDALGAVIDRLSLHSGDPSTTGANELSGGSPAYARQTPAWSASAAGVLSLSGSETFDVPAGSTVAFVGMWTNSGAVFRGYVPAGSGSAGGGTVDAFSVDDASTDTLDSVGHGLADADKVVALSPRQTGQSLPTGLSEGTVYHVRDSAADTFKLAATAGGAAIDLTSKGHGFVIKVTPEVFAAQGTYTVNDLDIPLA
jgi:hypothetical protein